MPSSAVPPPIPSKIIGIASFLDPILSPLHFAPGQVGFNSPNGQVIFCRGLIDSVDGGCVDLVIDVEIAAECRITGVRYWGFPSDRWHLEFAKDAALPEQLDHLYRSLPVVLDPPNGDVA